MSHSKNFIFNVRHILGGRGGPKKYHNLAAKNTRQKFGNRKKDHFDTLKNKVEFWEYK